MPEVLEFNQVVSLRVSPESFSDKMDRAKKSLSSLPATSKSTSDTPVDGKGFYHFYDLDWIVEVKKGGTRKGRKTTLHYGHIKGTKGKDGEGIDFWMDAEGLGIELFFVINQNKLDGTGLDEHKVMVGFKSEEKAKEGYLENYPEGMGKELLGSIKPMSLPQFQNWIEEGDKEKKAEKCPEGECCPHCDVRLERGDDGSCNSCGKPWPEKAAVDVTFKDGTKRDADELAQEIADKLRRAAADSSESRLLHNKVCALMKPFDDVESEEERPYTVAVDLDGTIAKKEEPFNSKTIGDPRSRALFYLKKFRKAGARIIIFTVRGDKALVSSWLDKNGVPYDFINENPDQPEDSSGKVLADAYWDDRGFNAEDPDEHGPGILSRIEDHVKAAAYYVTPEEILVELIGRYGLVATVEDLVSQKS